MKLRSLFISALSAIAFTACEDTLTDIGSSILPDTDHILVKSDAFEITSSTFLPERIYVRTPNPLLGQINDAQYGTVRSDYAAQMRIKPGLNLDVIENDSLWFDSSKEKVFGDKLDSMVLSISYRSFIGDSVIPMAVTVYELQQQLPSNTDAFYSDFDIAAYAEPLSALGSKGYTGINYNLSDSIREDEDYIPYVDIELNQSLVDRFYDAFTNKPETFKTQESFQEFFKGVYLKNTFGNGTILKVDATSIGIFYKTQHVGTDKDGKDSLYVKNRMKVISVTPDVIQLNSAKTPIQPGGNPELLNNDSTTYITTPGGYFTQIKLPVGKIIETVESNPNAIEASINNVSLNMLANAPSNIFYQAPPTNVLLVQKDSMDVFFEENRLPDYKTSYLATLPADSTVEDYGYDFGNINQMIVSLGEDIKQRKANGILEATDSVTMAIVPVTTYFDQQNNITRITNYFMPGGITLKRGEKSGPKSYVTYTQQIINEK